MNVARRDRPRRGMLLIAVLLCLLVLAIFAGVLVRAGAARRDGVRALERRLQAEWLAEAGLRRALARLDADPDYAGETWTIEARELGAADGATVAIAVERPAGGATRVHARADFPRDPPRRARCSREITLTPTPDPSPIRGGPR